MANEQVIERLRQGDWYVVCETVEKADLLLQACEKAGLKWNKIFKKATEFNPFKILSLKIGFCRSDKGLTHSSSNAYDKFGLENITDWFFNAIREETMFSNEIIAQLKQNDWIIECESVEKVYWLLQACEEAGIKCRSGRRATKFKPNAKKYPIIIIYCAEDKTIHQGMESKAGALVSFFVKEMGYKNITDWFFNAIKGENNG